MNILYYIGKLIKKLKIPLIKNSKLHKTSRICVNTLFINSLIGKYSYIGSNSSIIKTKIGSFCSISDEVLIEGGNHSIDRVSSSPVFHKGKSILNKNFYNHKFEPYSQTIIGSDVWIGYGAIIKAGLTVGDGSVIGMGTVVTKNIGPYEIFFGNPAKLIKKRFDEKTIVNLLDIKWWDYSDSELEKYSAFMINPKSFIERIKNEKHINEVIEFLEEKSFFLKENIFAYKMDRKSSIDIDEEIDFKIAKVLMDKNG